MSSMTLSMEGEGSEKRPHALLVPCGMQGHINPLMQLAQHLVACHGFQITFLTTHDNHIRIMQEHSAVPATDPPPLTHTSAAYISCRSSSYPAIELVGLSPAPAQHPNDHSPAPSFKQTNDHRILLPFIPLVERLISDVNRSSNPLTCIIADIFLYWLPPIARAAQIPSLLGFFICSGVDLALLSNAPSLLASGVVNSDGSINGHQELMTAIPGLSHIQPKDVSWSFGFPSEGIPVIFDQILSMNRNLKDYDFVLLNTFQDLETEALDGIVKSNIRAAAIGPLILLETHNSTHNMACSSLWAKDSDCLQWLEGRPNSSVIYVAFGSMADFNVSDLHELALGLEASKLAFLWVLGPHWMHKRNELFPKGFLERTRDRALFIPWAPQSSVLAHPSIGVFVTHCGWNSTMEAISLGAPMLTWPRFADQASNHRSVVEMWKIGMAIHDHDTVMDREEVKNVVLSIMLGAKGRKIRERSAKFAQEAKMALEKGRGKSFGSLQTVIKHIKGLSV